MIYLEIISASSPSNLVTDGSEYMGMISEMRGEIVIFPGA